ncbi:unnamed protein product [Mytilus coruscus]|uniref:Farnesoic acid O-methyl transferase domain-containing protein n=1 Tax=Mytilus coruscus TaxID=42192 RepID=A0A6J8ETU0_MYTCO|nr:unnamed protein product [Mytilus coruscus]
MGRCERIHRNLGGQIDESLKRHRYEDKQEEKNAKHSLKDCIENERIWNISASLVREIWVHTPNTGNGVYWVPNAPELSHPLNQYGYDASQNSSIHFDLKVCSDAFVYLSASPIMDKQAALYEICIGGGGGKKVFLRRQDPTFEDVASNVLGDGSTQCGSFQPFWISWQNGNIKIGKGLSINNKEVVDWSDPNPFIIRGVGVRTGVGQSGQWTIYTEALGYFCLHTDTRGTMELVKTTLATEYSCPYLCHGIHNCMGFNFNVHTSLCELISTGEPMLTVTDSGWTFGTKCFQGKCFACI